jgi:nucleoside-diphosphate-sugar epimerase
MTKLGIVGIGWLGTHFAEYSYERFDLWATTRHKSKLSDNLREKVEVFNFDLGGASHHLPIKDSKYLLFTIPPSKIADYASLCKDFFKEVLKLNPSIRIYFISSTSVYGKSKGKVDEESAIKPSTDNALKIVDVENYLLNTNAYILRCGGLIGEKRHPVYYLSGKQQIAKPQAAVNLVHQRDICRFINYSISNELLPAIYNLVSPQHPSRKEYYEEVAARLSIKAPDFDEDDQRKGKIVLPEKAIAAGFHFDYQSPFEMPLVRK